MADSNPKVMAMVERALKKNPDLSSTELHERAKKIDRSMGDLTGRQFHARYALAVRKKFAGGGKRRRKKKAKKRARKTGTRSAGGQRKGGRKKGGRGKTGARRGRPPRARRAAGAIGMLAETYESQKAALNDALDSAFQRAVRADSVQQIDELLTDVRQTAEKYGG